MPGAVRGEIEAGGIMITPSPDGKTCHCVYLIRTNLAGKLPTMVVQTALAMQCMSVANMNKVRKRTCLHGAPAN